MSKNRTRAVTVLAIAAFLVTGTLLGQSWTQAAGAAVPLPALTTVPTSVPIMGTAALTPAAAAVPMTGDPANDKTAATIDLQEGFIMDPYLLPVVGNGETAAADLVKGCNGFVGKDAKAVVNWSGSTDQLSFFVYSDGDPVLAVQGPDGSVLCNDDAGAATAQPLVQVKSPVKGAYKVFVGSAKRGEPALGFLAITKAPLNETQLAGLDLSPMLHRRAQPTAEPLRQLEVARLLTRRPAVFGSGDLGPGFKAVQAFAAGGGDIAAFRIEDKKLACAGFLSPIPSYSFTWKGKSQPLRVFFEAKQDSALAIVTPDQKVLCGINAGDGNQNPSIDIEAPGEGRYQVYIAGMQPNTVVPGMLTVTSDQRATPAVLAPVAQ